MNTIVAKIVKETNWTAVSVVGGFAVSAIFAFASLKSDVRDLGTQLVAVAQQGQNNASELAKMRDLFVANSFEALRH